MKFFFGSNFKFVIDGMLGSSHCEILNSDGGLIDELSCQCEFDTFMNIAMVTGCDWKKVLSNETVFLSQTTTQIAVTTSPSAPTGEWGIEYPFGNLPPLGSLEGICTFVNYNNEIFSRGT